MRGVTATAGSNPALSAIPDMSSPEGPTSVGCAPPFGGSMVVFRALGWLLLAMAVAAIVHDGLAWWTEGSFHLLGRSRPRRCTGLRASLAGMLRFAPGLEVHYVALFGGPRLRLPLAAFPTAVTRMSTEISSHCFSAA